MLDGKRHNAICVTSPSPGIQVDGLPGGVSTGAVIASWHRGRRATIGTFDMKTVSKRVANFDFAFSLICFDKFHVKFQMKT